MQLGTAMPICKSVLVAALSSALKVEMNIGSKIPLNLAGFARGS